MQAGACNLSAGKAGKQARAGNVPDFPAAGKRPSPSAHPQNRETLCDVGLRSPTSHNDGYGQPVRTGKGTGSLPERPETVSERDPRTATPRRTPSPGDKRRRVRARAYGRGRPPTRARTLPGEGRAPSGRTAPRDIVRPQSLACHAAGCAWARLASGPPRPPPTRHRRLSGPVATPSASPQTPGLRFNAPAAMDARQDSRRPVGRRPLPPTGPPTPVLLDPLCQEVYRQPS